MADVKDEEKEEKEEQTIDPNRTMGLEEAALRSLEDKSKESEDESAKPEEKPEAKEEEPAKEEAKPASEAEGEEGGEESDGDSEGYFADEGDVEEEPEESSLPAEKETSNWLLENLPQITVTGHRGEKPVTLQVKRADDLPADFEFNSQRDTIIFNQAIADQTQRAYQLINQLENQRQQTQAEQFTAQENRDIQSDIGKLQRAGELPTFTRGTDVDTDPKAETAREVLDYYNKENVKRLEASQKEGRMFHHLSYEDAFYLWKAQNPEVNKEQKAEDSERKTITRRAARGQRQGAASQETRKINLPRSANWDQVINAAIGE